MIILLAHVLRIMNDSLLEWRVTGQEALMSVMHRDELPAVHGKGLGTRDFAEFTNGYVEAWTACSFASSGTGSKGRSQDHHQVYMYYGT